jgi:EAL domain-containing protein (putative c-di-GMP-specific phosphodiesterase class I)
MATDRTDAAIVRSTISLSHELGLEVVAEGVEDRATWDLLARLGCDLAQGYYLSRPLPPDELLGWMAACADWHVDPVEKQPVVPIIALDAITAVA